MVDRVGCLGIYFALLGSISLYGVNAWKRVHLQNGVSEYTMCLLWVLHEWLFVGPYISLRYAPNDDKFSIFCCISIGWESHILCLLLCPQEATPSLLLCIYFKTWCNCSCRGNLKIYYIFCVFLKSQQFLILIFDEFSSNYCHNILSWRLFDL